MSSGGEERVGREEAEALLETRRELGPSYDAALVDSFADRLERALAQRVDAEVELRRKTRADRTDRDSRQLALGIVSIGCGIPISAIAAGTADLPGLVVAWAGMVGINVAYAVSGRRRD